MRKFTFVLLSLFIMGSAIAQNSDNKWAIGLGPGAYYNLEMEELGFLGEFYISRYLSPRFDLMLKTEAGFNDDGVDLVNPLLNLRLKLFNEANKFQPYLFGGVGYLWDNLDEGVNFNGGIGAKIPISPKTSLYLEGGYIHGIEATRYNPDNGMLMDVDDNFVKLNGIIEFAFGKAKDSDGD
ncbi:MAG: hypothetical protein PHH93_08640, partial [Prolixibacteraceae bacterium]|nr:hypothetical protein [Prolixibacteraceae bacterium]